VDVVARPLIDARGWSVRSIDRDVDEVRAKFSQTLSKNGPHCVRVRVNRPVQCHVKRSAKRATGCWLPGRASAFIVQDAGIRFVRTQAHGAGRLSELSVTPVFLDAAHQEVVAQPCHRMAKVDPGELW